MQLPRTALAAATAAFFIACGGSADDSAADERDLSLAPAESLAVDLDDQPQAEEEAEPIAQRREERREPSRRPPVQREPEPEPEPLVPSLSVGTVLELAAADTLTSRHNEQGEEVYATGSSAILDENGDEVIPAGAVFAGTISDIAPAGSPGAEGRMVLTFSRVMFGGETYTIQARVDTLGTFMKGRGISGGDVARVGAGAVVGAIAGRVIGGNRTGAIVGAAAGAAAGVGILAATRDTDIILPGGALIRLVLTGPFELTPVGG